MSSGNSSSFSMPQNQEKKRIPRYEVRSTIINHPFMWLVCKTRAKILLSDPETSLTTPRLLPLRRWTRSYGNYQSPQSSVVSKTETEARSTQISKTKHPRSKTKTPKSRKRRPQTQKQRPKNSKTKHLRMIENEAPKKPKNFLW